MLINTDVGGFQALRPRIEPSRASIQRATAMRQNWHVRPYGSSTFPPMFVNIRLGVSLASRQKPLPRSIRGKQACGG